ncbi:MAG: winged helix-turn-helix domain-containing protein [Gammaproteobacteria bacterium]|nr:winged helix-turn-helix domain-containing protein [Gammaproteobacteria bacterium]MBU1555831.1 winged helix-turn-helix domain-containing protein [Gammaproteobacteria bacterium]MBU2068663.1 winged helix-turn-helix domain-containing protein [Gammaproteobacteria bacterium]MBU2183733.1 winged helix-turn-helix domain-containing protein [Gammaproteobacteria bacterium]MBU2205793.1 winged helix-turn-helix domain-containing protein [Gammaproteobacteria bacterium]
MRDTFFFADWQVDPAANTLRRGKQLQQLEPKAMDVLVLLCRHAGEVLSSDDIVTQCWPGIDTGDNPLHKTLTQLRKALGDSATAPTYIETIRKRGYRTLAEVRFPLGQEQSVQQQSWQQGSPFPGLQAYDARYASVFFGRGAQIDTLLSRIAQQIKFGRDFCLLLGPSGSGKSSLINAGVMPNLMQPGGFNGIEVVSFSSLDLADVSAGQLYSSLASTLLDWEINDAPVFAGDSAASLADKLQQQPQQVLQHCVRLLANNRQHCRRFAIFVDRLEVLLSSPLFSEPQRSAFVSLLEQLATSAAVLVISACRNEFYPDLVDYPSLMAGKAKGAHFDLAAPGRADLLQMVRLPALAAGLSFDSDAATALALDEILVQEAASNPDALPMLQYTLQQLYLQRSSDNKLLFSVYNTLGGIEGAIGKNAEQAIKGLGKAEQDSLPKVLSLLVTLREDEQSITSRSARLAQLQTDAERALVNTMVEQRLFVSHLQHGEPCFSIAHEALLRRWPRATAWITEHHDSLSVKSRLLHLSQRWRSEQQNSAYLLAEGKPLQEALLLQQNRLFQLEAEETEFIQASHAKARLKRWSRRGTFAILCLLTVAAVTMGIRSFQAEQQAQQKRLAAENLLGFMVGDFADKLRSIGRMDLLDGISNKALEYFTDYSSDDSNLSIEARLQHGQTLEAMGEVAYSRGKTDEAIAALQAARLQLEAVLAQQPDNLELLKTLGANAFWLGQIQYDASNWQGTQPEFERYYQYSERMYELAPDNVDAIMELSYATNSLGSLAMKQQQFDVARQNFEESLRLKLRAQSADPDKNRFQADIANARSWLASSAQSSGNVNLAIQTHQQLQTELTGMNIVSQEPYLLFRLAGSYQILADLMGYQGRISEAKVVAEAGFSALSRALEQDPDNKSWQKRKHYYYFQSFKFSLHLTVEEIEYNRKNLVQTVNDESVFLTDVDKKEFIARHWLTSALHYTAMEMFIEAKQYADLASTSLNELTQEYPQNHSYLALLSDIQLLKAKTLMALGQSSDALALCGRVEQKIGDITADNKDPKYLISYTKSLDCQGKLESRPELITLLRQNGVVDFNF